MQIIKEHIERNEFKQAVKLLVEKYGENYALPDPYRFEAMNINVLWRVLEKLSADPIDDILREKLYQYKIGQFQRIVRIAQKIWIYLPKVEETKLTLENMDRFLQYHKESSIKNFRRKIESLARKPLTDSELATEIQIEMHEASKKWKELGISKYVISMIQRASSIIPAVVSPNMLSFATATIGSLSAVKYTIDYLRKKKEVKWYNFIRGVRAALVKRN